MAVVWTRACAKRRLHACLALCAYHHRGCRHLAFLARLVSCSHWVAPAATSSTASSSVAMTRCVALATRVSDPVLRASVCLVAVAHTTSHPVLAIDRNTRCFRVLCVCGACQIHRVPPLVAPARLLQRSREAYTVLGRLMVMHLVAMRCGTARRGYFCQASSHGNPSSTSVHAPSCLLLPATSRRPHLLVRGACAMRSRYVVRCLTPRVVPAPSALAAGMRSLAGIGYVLPIPIATSGAACIEVNVPLWRRAAPQDVVVGIGIGVSF